MPSLDDLKKRINLPIVNMPREVFVHAKTNCRKHSSIGLLATEGTLKTGVYNKFFDKDYNLVFPNNSIQSKSVNKAIRFVKMGKVKLASKAIKPAINYLIKKKCKKIILGCTELHIDIFAYKQFKTIKSSKISTTFIVSIRAAAKIVTGTSLILPKIFKTTCNI